MSSLFRLDILSTVWSSSCSTLAYWTVLTRRILDPGLTSESDKLSLRYEWGWDEPKQVQDGFASAEAPGLINLSLE